MTTAYHRSHLMPVYEAALRAVNGEHAVSEFFKKNPLDAPMHVVAIGKAAGSMLQGANNMVGTGLISGLVISTSDKPTLADQRFHWIQGGHPLPDARSVHAGSALLDYICHLPDKAKVLFLISGGASALVEVLSEPMDLPQLIQLNQWLLSSGLPIWKINAIRQQVSCIKGGKLNYWLGGRKSTCLIISDVENDDPATIGSGLLFSPSRDGASTQVPPTLPEHIQQSFRAAEIHSRKYLNADLPEHWRVVANNHDALEAAKQQAEKLGYRCQLHATYLKGDAVQQGTYLAGYALSNTGVMHIWGGETTMVLPSRPGLGGRCQSLALSAARKIAGTREVCLLAAGSDGRDGPTDFAGALVDNTTLSRGNGIAGFNAEDSLARADASRYLLACEDTIPARFTGTNVADIVLAYCD